MNRALIALVSVAFALNCKPQTKEDANVTEVTSTSAQTAGPSTESPPETMPASAPESGASSSPSGEAISARVAVARQKLSATESGQKIWASIEAAGGLTPWFSSGDFRFRFAYVPVGRDATDTTQTIDTWGARARHRVSDSDVEFGWDGRAAWVNPPDAELKTNARFWSLTPYYFVGIPFVLADPGVVTEALPDQEFEGKSYDVVKASFEAGTGDAPDDYYIVYMDKQTHRVRAIRYVVSYKGFRPDGGHGPEKLMSYDGDVEAGGLTFAATHRTFKYDESTGELGEKVTDVTVSDVAFTRDRPEGFFKAPEGAKVIEGWK